MQHLIDEGTDVNVKDGDGVSTVGSGELRHRTCHFCTRYTGISKFNSVYRNLKDQMKLELYIDEALSYTLVPWKPYLWVCLTN